MALQTQLRSCFFRYGIQIRRLKSSLIGLLLIPIIGGIFLWVNLAHFPDGKAEIAIVIVGFSYSSYIRIIIGDIVNDRREKARELMLMKGLSSYNYHLGILIFALVKSI